MLQAIPKSKSATQNNPAHIADFKRNRFQYLILSVWLIHCFSYTLSPALLSISFMLLCLAGIFEFRNYKPSGGERLLMALFVAYYLSSAISYFYSANTDEALRKLILKLPVLCFPLLLPLFRKLQPLTLIYMALIWMYAFFLPGIVSVYNYLINKTLFDQLILESKPLPVEFGYGIYHIQFSILLASTVLLGLYMLISGKLKNREPLLKYFFIILLSFNVVILHILSARTGLLAMYTGIGILMLSGLKNLNVRKRFILLSAVCMIPLLMYLFSSSLRNRMQNTLNDLKVVWTGSDANDYSFAMRVKAWRNAADLIAAHPLAGVGIGDADSALYEHFGISHPNMKPHNRKNPHFQLLETAVQSGLISALLFMALVLTAFSIQVPGKPILASAIALLFISSCFESILERQTSVAGFSILVAFCLALGFSHLTGHVSKPEHPQV